MLDSISTPSVDAPAQHVTEKHLEMRLATELLRREHRLHRIVLNLWHYRRSQFPDRSDPRVQACAESFIWRIIAGTAPAAVGASVGVVAVLGLVLAWNANALAAEQNAHVHEQTVLAEAQRRAALGLEVSCILDELDEELDVKQSAEFALSPQLRARIVAATLAARPYRFLETTSSDAPADAPERLTNRLVPRPISPERGQLLIALLSAGVPMESLHVQGADFSFADLRSIKFPSRAGLSGIRLRSADLSGSGLNAADLRCSDLRNAVFDEADLGGAWLSHCLLDGASFRNANLGSAILADSSLSNTQFFGAVLCGTQFLHRSGQPPQVTSAAVDALDTVSISLSPNGTDVSRALLLGAIVSMGGADCEVGRDWGRKQFGKGQLLAELIEFETTFETIFDLPRRSKWVRGDRPVWLVCKATPRK